MNKWLGAGIAILGPLAAIMVWVGGIAGEAADTKRRLLTVEERVKEDRRDTRSAIGRVDAKVEQIDATVNKILSAVQAMEAVQKAEASRRGR